MENTMSRTLKCMPPCHSAVLREKMSLSLALERKDTEDPLGEDSRLCLPEDRQNLPGILDLDINPREQGCLRYIPDSIISQYYFLGVFEDLCLENMSYRQGLRLLHSEVLGSEWCQCPSAPRSGLQEQKQLPNPLVCSKHAGNRGHCYYHELTLPF